MKIYIKTSDWSILKIEHETPVMTGNNYVDYIKVYFDSNPSEGYFYPTLNILKPNNRKVGPFNFDTASPSYPLTETDEDDEDLTWYYYAFTLSSDNGQIDVAGKYQMTIYINLYSGNNITGQRSINFMLNVAAAVALDNNNIIVLGDDPETVITNMQTLINQLATSNASLSNSKADRTNSSQTITAGTINVTTDNITNAFINNAEFTVGNVTFYRGSEVTFYQDSEVTFYNVPMFDSGFNTNSQGHVYLRPETHITGKLDVSNDTTTIDTAVLTETATNEIVLQAANLNKIKVYSGTNVVTQTLVGITDFTGNYVWFNNDLTTFYETVDFVNTINFGSGSTTTFNGTAYVNGTLHISSDGTLESNGAVNLEGNTKITNLQVGETGGAGSCDFYTAAHFRNGVNFAQAPQITTMTNFASSVPRKDYVDNADALKVNIADIVNNLTSTSTNVPLSAYQGKVLKDLITAIQTLLASDDTTLDELQEIVDYVKDNRDLIESITNSKVSVSDIIDNLTSAVSNKPLSANQGYILKGLIDAIVDGTTAVGNATNAENDGEGNNIVSTYLNKNDAFASSMISVSDYDESTGTIVLTYDSATTSIDYNDSTGIVTFTY